MSLVSFMAFSTCWLYIYSHIIFSLFLFFFFSRGFRSQFAFSYLFYNIYTSVYDGYNVILRHHFVHFSFLLSCSCVLLYAVIERRSADGVAGPFIEIKHAHHSSACRTCILRVRCTLYVYVNAHMFLKILNLFFCRLFCCSD